MASAIRTVGHQDRLSLVDHLDELRTRLLISALALAVAFGVCFWQNHALLTFVNKPFAKETVSQAEKGNGPQGQTYLAQQGVLAVGAETEAIAAALSAPHSGLSAATRAQLAAQIPRLRAQMAKIPKVPPANKPVTLGIGEPLTTTLSVTLYFALLLALPVILFELYGFVLPAFSPRERRAVQPLLLAIPVLFAIGVAFGYYVVLPAAVHFLLNFNSAQFNVLVQGNQYYKFAATTLLAMGLVFQVPVAILATVRAGIVTPDQLRRGRRFAIVACAAVAAFLPGDVTTMLLETIPLYLLYEASILLASFVTRRERRREAASAGAAEGTQAMETDTTQATAAAQANGAAAHTTEQSVQEIIDHTDPELSD
jgi:sec-independent protein translocase protein TatC